MDVAEFNSEIRAAWAFLSGKLGIGRAFIWNTTLPISVEFRDVALDDTSTFSSIYRRGLSLSHYNILLNDYSYFQFTWDHKSSWRLAYFPNPWVAGVSAAANQLEAWESQEQFGTLSHEDVSMLMDELEYYGSIPPLRFEYSTNQYKEIAHPAAHFHIGRDSANRWPVAIAIGPSLFALLVAKFYYSAPWALQSRFHGALAPNGCVDDILIETAAAARFVHDFSDVERRSPHFGRNLAAIARKASGTRQAVAPRKK